MLQPQPVARIEGFALPRAAVGEHFSETRRIPQTEVEALPCNRMKGLGRVADHREPLRDMLVRPSQRERIELTRSDSREPSDSKAELRLQASQEVSV